MKYYLISDTHFGHKDKMMQYCGRPENYEELLWNNLSKLTSQDCLIHLGDICIRGNRETHNRIQELSCRKILVKGNHDYKNYAWYMNNGWDFVCDSFSLRINRYKILFTHIPMAYDKSMYNLNIHGHMHNSVHRGDTEDFVFKGCCYKLVACEFLNYAPISLEAFLSTTKVTNKKSLLLKLAYKLGLDKFSKVCYNEYINKKTRTWPQKIK